MPRKILTEKPLTAPYRPAGVPADLPMYSWIPETAPSLPSSSPPTPPPSLFIWLPSLNVLSGADSAQLRQIIQNVPPGTQLVCWSGSCGTDLFTAHPANWMGTGFRAFLDFADEIRDDLRSAKVRLLFRPHARQILSDPPIGVEFMRQQLGLATDVPPTQFRRADKSEFGLVLSPIALFEPSMVPDRADHLRRIFSLLSPLAEAIILDDGQLINADDEISLLSATDDITMDGILDWDILHECLTPEGVEVGEGVSKEIPQMVPLILAAGVNRAKVAGLCELGGMPDSSG